jgi:beta-phosphoglucomutase-like phosphatase (HAD superfamily)
LRHYFGEHVYCAYEVGSFKPEPGLFLHAAHALGVPPTDCAVVEDSLPGVQAALAAGMRVFSLLPQHLAHGVPEAQVTFVESLQKVGEHLNLF